MFSIPQTDFYVYTLSDPSDVVFYVGKGIGPRIKVHEAEAKNTACDCRKCRKIRKIWKSGGQVKRAILFTTPIERDAYIYEAKLIAQIGIGNLVNYRESDQHVQSCYTLPSKPFYEFSDSEYTDYLNSLRGLSKAARKKKLYQWRTESLIQLRQQWGQCRRYRQPERAAAILERMEQIKIQLGWITQEPFDF